MSKAWLTASLRLWQRKLAYRQTQLRIAQRSGHRDGKLSLAEADRIRKWKASVAEAEVAIAGRIRDLAAIRPLREKAYDEAKALVGIMEVGGNNVGPQVSALIREGGGIPGQAWCGWLMAVCYRRAGSRAVGWAWGAVRLLLPLSGLSRTERPERGDLVRFEFTGDHVPDHVGMFVGWCDQFGAEVPRAVATHIRSIEGNTGATGAVSDSKHGGDGVYEKVRSRSLVRDFVRVSR